MTSKSQTTLVYPFSVNGRQMCVNCEHFEIIGGKRGFCDWCEKEFPPKQQEEQSPARPEQERQEQEQQQQHQQQDHSPSTPAIPNASLEPSTDEFCDAPLDTSDEEFWDSDSDHTDDEEEEQRIRSICLSKDELRQFGYNP